MYEILGHVDFSFEVNRSLSACEGALLLVDASQGIQAQTLATYHSALELGLEVERDRGLFPPPYRAPRYDVD